MILYEEYIKLPKEQRRSHLILEESCIERGGCSTHFKALLAHFTDTTIPSGRGVYLCHACNNSKCSNPKHLYWGTPKDNYDDYTKTSYYASWGEKSKRKHGLEFFKKIGSIGGRKSRKHTMSPERLEEYKTVFSSIDKSKRGWITEAATQLGVSHTHVRRVFNKHFSAN